MIYQLLIISRSFANGGELGADQHIIDWVMAIIGILGHSISEEQMAKVRVLSEDGYLGIAFLLEASKSRYGLLMQNLQNEYLWGNDKYPASLASA